MSPSVVVVGGGVAGLTTAFRLSQRGVDVAVVESSDHVGGRLRSVTVGDLELEAGPDSFVARKPWAVELCRELGLELDAPRASRAQMWTERGLVDLPPSALGVPSDASALWSWAGLSRAGRIRALADLVKRARPDGGDAPLGSLLRRRLGDEATERLVAPLLAGLFAGDVDRLGAAATFPELPEWERRFGSLIRGAKAATSASATAGPMFVRPRAGVAVLPNELAERLGAGAITTRTAVRKTEPRGGGFAITADVGAMLARCLVLATPSSATADFVAQAWPKLAAHLRMLRTVSTAVVLLVYGEGTATALPDATGFVVPRERAPMTAATFLSRKWPDDRFRTRAVVRCFVGADGSEDVIDAPDDDLVHAVAAHLAAVTGLPPRPEHAAVVRWPGAMPQYEVGHLGRVDAIERSLPPGMFVVGNAYRGVGVADTVHGANEAAEAIHAYLGEHDRTEPVG